MGRMKELYERIWEEHCLDEMLDNEQIAERLDCPVDWVRTALQDHYDKLAERNGY